MAGLLALTVLALTFNLFVYGGAGLMTLHPYVYYSVAALALIIPVFWATGHLCMGLIMGLSGGGLKEGLKLGLMLGLGMALGRCWLNIAAVGAGILLAQGPLLWGCLALVVAAFCYALNWAIHYFWHQHQFPVN